MGYLMRLGDEGSCVPCGVALLGRAYDLAGQADSAVTAYGRYLYPEPGTRMAQERTLGLGARLVGEMAVIFLSVVLALGADDWREARAERAEARQSLEVILTDLRRDSVRVRSYAGLIEPRAVAARALLDAWDRTNQHPDTLDRRFQMALSGPRGSALHRAGFEGLIGSNGLRLVDDPALRARLLDYYQWEQPSFVEFARAAEDLRLQARRQLAPYAVWPGDTYLRLVSPWRDIAGDDLLRHDLAWSLRMREGLLTVRVPQIQARIDELIRVVADEVGS